MNPLALIWCGGPLVAPPPPHPLTAALPATTQRRGTRTTRRTKRTRQRCAKRGDRPTRRRFHGETIGRSGGGSMAGDRPAKWRFREGIGDVVPHLAGALWGAPLRRRWAARTRAPTRSGPSVSTSVGGADLVGSWYGRELAPPALSRGAGVQRRRGAAATCGYVINGDRRAMRRAGSCLTSQVMRMGIGRSGWNRAGVCR